MHPTTDRERKLVSLKAAGLELRQIAAALGDDYGAVALEWRRMVDRERNTVALTVGGPCYVVGFKRERLEYRGQALGIARVRNAAGVEHEEPLYAVHALKEGG